MTRPTRGLLTLVVLYLNGLATVSATLGTLRSKNATVTGSSQHSEAFALRKAVDGSNRTDGDSCKCCAATDTQKDPWLRVDMGRLYRVSSVELFGRTEKYQDLTGMAMFVHEQPDDWTTTHALKLTIPYTRARYYKFPLNTPVIGRYVTIQLIGRVLLAVCELKIYSKDCADGSYAQFCDQTCGHCQKGETCDHVTGSCKQCSAGYLGATCKMKCRAGTFGGRCSARCHCLNGQTCNHVTGACPDGRCDLGWHGNNCSNMCKPGRYGENCKETCGHCNDTEFCERRTGLCRSCSSGYTGDMCTSECQPGMFGKACAISCGNCTDPCDVFTGKCHTGCNPGYTGLFCTERHNVLKDSSVRMTMSSVHEDLNATNASDGVLVADPEVCRCCSQTDHEDISWWQADLGSPTIINQINVYGPVKENFYRQLVGFQILLSMSGHFQEAPVHINNDTFGDNVVVINLPDTVTQFVMIQRVGTLTVCEVEILESGVNCPNNTHGVNCVSCGHCNNGSCDRVTGQCLDGCLDTFEGPQCMRKPAIFWNMLRVVALIVGSATALVLIIAVIVVKVCMRRKTEHTYEGTEWRQQETENAVYMELERTQQDSRINVVEEIHENIRGHFVRESSLCNRCD